jgi:hypothetical protein
VTDAIAIPLIIIIVALVIVGTLGIHTTKANNPLFNFFIIILVGSIIAFGVVIILSLLSLLSSLGS